MEDIRKVLNFKKYKLKKKIIVKRTPEILCQIDNKEDSCSE